MLTAGLAACRWSEEDTADLQQRAVIFAAMLRPFQADSTETLMVLTVLCCAGTVPQVLGVPPRGACLLQGGVHPSSAAETEVTPPPSSAASATVPEDNSDPVDMDSELTYNEASVINSDGIMYSPFDRPP